MSVGTKSTTAVPLDGATRGSSHTRAPAKGATAAPPPPRRVRSRVQLRRLSGAAKTENGREVMGARVLGGVVAGVLIF